MRVLRTALLGLSLSVFSLNMLAPAAHAEDEKKAAGRQTDQFSKDMDAYLAKDENLEKMGNALSNFFQKKQRQAQQDQEVALKQRTDKQFDNPIQVNISGSPVKGKDSAKVTIVEFSDFQCPYCRRGFEVVNEILKNYPNDVKVVFKHLPLPFHQQARPAAIAAVAAQEQGKFWEMHDLLFENQAQLSPEKYVEFAQKIGLDMEKFKKDLLDEEIAKRVTTDSEQAEELGIRGTPGFLVNGVQIDGARPFADFKVVIDRWLAKAKKA